jgi:hypothetical protein
VLAELGRRLGIDALGGIDHDDTAGDAIIRRVASASRDGADALIAAGPRGLQAPAWYGWVHDRVLPGHRWRLAPRIMIDQLPQLLELPDASCVLVSQRVMHNHNSVPYAQTATGPVTPVVNVNPDDAPEWQIGDGDLVRVTSSVGQLEGRARLDRRLRRGTVSINHGWLQPDVAHLVDSNDVDPLSGQPVQTGIVRHRATGRARRVGVGLIAHPPMYGDWLR